MRTEWQRMIEIITSELDQQQQQDSLQAHFQPNFSADEIEQVYQLKRAQPLLQVFTALFHGGFDGVLVRLLVLRELASDAASSTFSRADINTRLAYLLPESLETVLMRLRTNQLLAWDAQQAVYRVTPMARNVLSAIDGLLTLGKNEDTADMGFLLSQVAGAQVMGGVTVDQLNHLLGRLVDLTEEFSDAIASGSEFRLRASQAKWHTACDWVEKGSEILRAILSDENADGATHKAAQAIGRAIGAAEYAGHVLARAEPDRTPARPPGPVRPVHHRHQTLAAAARRPGLAGRRRDRPAGGAAVYHPGRDDRRRRDRTAAGPRHQRRLQRPSRRHRRPDHHQRRPADAARAGRLAGAPVRLRRAGQLPQHRRRRPEIDPGAGFAATGVVRRGLLPRLAAAAAGRRRRGPPARRHRRTGAPAGDLHSNRRNDTAARFARGGDVPGLPLTVFEYGRRQVR